jgi:hypothetical protein
MQGKIGIIRGVVVPSQLGQTAGLARPHPPDVVRAEVATAQRTGIHIPRLAAGEPMGAGNVRSRSTSAVIASQNRPRQHRQTDGKDNSAHGTLQDDG